MFSNQAQSHRGHTASSYEDYNLRAFVAKVAAAHPRAGREDMYRRATEAMIDEMERDPSAARAVATHWATNAVNAYLDMETRDRPRVSKTPTELLTIAAHETILPREPRDSSFTPSQSKERKTERLALVKRMEASIKAQIALLPLIMPNGKPMSECTGREMGDFGTGYYRIAVKAGDRIVGKVLSEEQVRALMVPL